jgi:NAD(P)-dependent dehydrogenase (short-subunit alcohol dehydrogenase family)
MEILKGSIALVTGGARGIGAAIAMRYAREAAAVIAADIDLAGAEGVAAEIRAAGGTADASYVDIGEPQESSAMVSRVVARFGRMDVMVNNAGVIRVSRLLDDRALLQSRMRFRAPGEPFSLDRVRPARRSAPGR